MNFARPYVPTSASICSNASGESRTGTRVRLRGGRPIGRAVAGMAASDKKTAPFSIATVNGPVYINGTHYGGKAMSDLQKKSSEAAGAWGAGMSAWERGEITRRDLGTLKRRMDRAEAELRGARYAG